MFDNLEKTLFQIRQVIVNSEKVRKLLYNDNADALLTNAPSVEDVSKYVVLYPIIEFDNNSPWDQHSCVNIFSFRMEPEDDVSDFIGVIHINIAMDVQKWTLSNSKIRPLELADEIIRLVDSKKFSAATKLEYSNMQYFAATKNICGYTLTFVMSDGNAEEQSF